MIQKFKLFRWLDTAMFGGINAIPTGALIYCLFNNIQAQPQAEALMITVTVVFWAIYVAFLVARYYFLKQITFITKHNIAVIANGFSVSQTEIEAETQEMIDKWNIACNFNKASDAVSGLWVKFETFPIEDNISMGKLAGYVIGKSSVVGWKADLKTTALQHEEGHVIYNEYVGTSGMIDTNEACHKFMSEHGLP